jgi:16S rRNA (cytosine967-C5)-methyltransferase
MMNNDGRVLAFDLHPNRVKLIRSGAERLGLTCVRADVNNAKVFNPNLPLADRVLVDAPCSGLGVIRRKPEIKYKDPAEFDRLPVIQAEILDTASRYVKVNGLLVYSTCTVSKAENEEVVKQFLASHEDFEPADSNDAFMQTITPDMYGSDGFFIAKLRRRR